MTQRLALLVNPTSGKGKFAQHSAEVVRRLMPGGYDVSVLQGVDAADAADLARAAVADGCDVLVMQVNRVHQFAVDVELQLPMGGIADSHRPRALVALQVIQRFLREFGPAVNAVHQLQRAGVCSSR